MSDDLLDSFRSLHPSGTRTLFVSGNGDDRRDGLGAGSARRSIQGALDLARAGDRIVVGDGVYAYTSVLDKHGTAQAWITIEAAPGTSPIVDVAHSAASWDTSRQTNGIDIQLSDHVAVYGLEVRGLETSSDPDPSGIAVFRGSHHISIWSCHVHDFPGGGINCFYADASTVGGRTLPAGGWDAVDVFFNHVHATSKYSPFNTSGVSFYGAEDLTGGDTIDGVYGYRAVGNYIHDVICTVPYTPGGYSFVTDGNGISPDSLAVPNSLHPRLTPYRKRGLIEGNIVTACGGRGVHIFNSVNIDVVNNTLIGNLRTSSPAITGSTEVDVQLDTPVRDNGIVIANNILGPRHTDRAFDRTARTVVGNTALGGTDPIPAGNQSLRSLGLDLFEGDLGEDALIEGVPLDRFQPTIRTFVAGRAGSLGMEAMGGTGVSASEVVVGAVRTP